MSSPLPGSPWRGPGTDKAPRRFRVASSGRLRYGSSLWLPLGDATPLHSITLSAVLVLDAVLVLLVSPRATGVLPNGPAIYLLLPAAAGLYMSLVALAARPPKRILVLRDPSSFLPLFAVAWTLGLVILVALSGGPWGSVSRTAQSSWTYPLSLAGISLAIAGLWTDGALAPQPRWLRLGLLLLPPILAGATRLPAWTDSALVVVTATTLCISAVVFPTSQSIPFRTRPVPAPPVPATAPTGHFGLASRARAEDRSPVGAPGSSSNPPIVAPSPSAPSTPAMPALSRSLGKWPNVASTGFRGLDALLMGGFPRWGQVATVARSDPSGETVILGTLTEGLRRGEPVVIASPPALRSVIRERIERLRPRLGNRARSGQVLWVDVAVRNSGGLSPESVARDSSVMVDMLRSLHAASMEAERRSPKGFCLGFFGLRGLFEAVGEVKASALVQNIVGILRERPILALYSIELGGASDRAILRCVALLDGALLFRSTTEGSFVKVFRLEPAERRDWVEALSAPESDSRRPPSGDPGLREGSGPVVGSPLRDP